MRLCLLPMSLALACSAPTAGLEREPLRVFAAASLRDVFSGLGEVFERARPDADVTFQFAGTQELRVQLENGAAADVFASADRRLMEDVVRAGRVEQTVVFARNEPVIVVSKEAAGRIRSLADLAMASRLVLGTKDVPIGRYTTEILDRAGKELGADFRARVEAKIVSRELNVRQVLTKVQLGEADAGIVYRSDVLSLESATFIPIPPEFNVLAEYPIGIVKGSAHAALAGAWVELVLGAEGRHALVRAGFSAPGS